MKETWDAKQLVPYITGPYNQPKAGVENVRSMKYKVSIHSSLSIVECEGCRLGQLH